MVSKRQVSGSLTNSLVRAQQDKTQRHVLQNLTRNLDFFQKKGEMACMDHFMFRKRSDGPPTKENRIYDNKQFASIAKSTYLGKYWLWPIIQYLPIQVVICSLIVQTCDDLYFVRTDYLPIISWFIATSHWFARYYGLSGLVMLIFCESLVRCLISRWSFWHQITNMSPCGIRDLNGWCQIPMIEDCLVENKNKNMFLRSPLGESSYDKDVFADLRITNLCQNTHFTE